MASGTPTRAWEHAGIRVSEGRLLVSGRDAEELARQHGTPLYVADLQRVGEKVRLLQDALSGAGLRNVTRLALKANREPELLRFLRSLAPPEDPRSVGLDVCSPGEVLHALAYGWRPQQISFTGTNVSDYDFDVIAPLPVHINVDLPSQIDRLGRRFPGRTIGLRINPRVGAQGDREEGSFYSGAKATKFGIYKEDLERALALADSHGLVVDTVHLHVAHCMFDDKLPAFDAALREAAGMVRFLVERGCPIKEINIGGGLGTPALEGETPLDLERFAAILKSHLGQFDVAVGVEPGEFLVNDSTVLLAEVITVEQRLDTLFVGLDVGWNVLCDRFVYGRDQEIVLCRAADAARTTVATISGHINEGDDLFAEGYAFPQVVEGDIVAIMAAGGYNQAQMSLHCLRPYAQAVSFWQRA
jgi:diaminopimelate decarboxylase